jgi:hypothetical protein
MATNTGIGPEDDGIIVVGTRELHYFPDVALALQEEIMYQHPGLVEVFSKYPNASLANKLASIAAYCNVLVDGAFDDKGLESLMRMLLEKLKAKAAANWNTQIEIAVKEKERLESDGKGKVN